MKYMMAKTDCIDCEITMQKAFTEYKGMKFEALQCPRCKQKIFTEDQTLKAVKKLEARKLKEEVLN